MEVGMKRVLSLFLNFCGHSK